MCLLCRTAARSAGYMRPAVARWAYTSRSTSQASPHFRERVTLGTTIASTVSDALAVSRRSGWHLTGAGRSGCLTGALVPQPIQMCDQGTRPGFDIGPPRRGAQQQRLREDAAATGSHCIMHFALRPRTRNVDAACMAVTLSGPGFAPLHQQLAPHETSHSAQKKTRAVTH